MVNETDLTATSVCPVCNERFCLTCGGIFSKVPSPHEQCEPAPLREWEKNDLPPCFTHILDAIT